MPTHDFVDIGDVLGFELLQGIIASVDASTDTCVVTVGTSTLNALLFYHCKPDSTLRENGAIKGAAAGFSPGNPVIVMKQIKDDLPVIKVIAHISGIQPCAGHGNDFYAFYKDGANLKIANCAYVDAPVVNLTKAYSDVFAANTTNPVSFWLKRFTHNVPATDANGNVTIAARDLYFVATSIYIPPAPFNGWTAFATGNPDHPMVTNNKNTKIPYTAKVLADLNSVNFNYNHDCTYSPTGISSSWYVMPLGGSGACAEFALGKAQALLDLGYPASAIHVEGGFYAGSTIGHAWCVVQTTGGDFALDIGSDAAKSNVAMTFTPAGTTTPLALYGRLRQIGSNWAFINSYGWVLGSTNQASPNVLCYILDPLLNIFYLMTPAEVIPPLFRNIMNTKDATVISSPSVNFSEDNNFIYIAYKNIAGANIIKTFSLQENKLALINSKPYTANGFVGRDGNIVEGVDLSGRQDFDNWGLNDEDISLHEISGVYHLSSIAPERLGDFKCLYDCEVVSENGYFSYHYRYFTGTFSVVTEGNTKTFLIEWKDTDRPDEDKRHMKTVAVFDVHGNMVSGVSDPYILSFKYQSAQFMGKVLGDTSFFQHSELLDLLFHPRDYQYPASGWNDYFSIYGEEIPFFTVDPIPNTYDPRFPIAWNHIEINEQLLFKGALFNRTTDVGDNLKRMYKNGVPCTATIATAVGCTESNLLGLAFIPSANRLN